MISFKKSFECADHITKNFLSNFRPHDMEENLLYKIDGDKIYARKVNQLIAERAELSEKIYYSPTYFPLISNYDMRLGTAWTDWTVINFDTCSFYDNNTNKITLDKCARHKISLTNYIKKLENIIGNNIEKIFAKDHTKTVYLAYSRGIDSLCILSFLIKKNLTDRVKLLNFSNTLLCEGIQSFELEKSLGLDVINFTIDMDHLCKIINFKNFKTVLCYTTHTLMKKFPGSFFIFGWHGNQSLLHKKIFLEQINKEVTKRGYCQSLDEWKPNISATPLNEHCFVIKPWHELQGTDDCELFDPLGNKTIFELTRSIDWENIDPHVISHAEIPRKIIYNNVNNMLDKLIIKENLNECDVIFGDLEVPLAKLNKEIFEIDSTGYCNKHGVDWLLSEYHKSLTKNTIKLNTVLGFLLHNYLNMNKGQN